MGRPVETARGMFKVDMSHQEIERLLTELEEWYHTCNAEWMTIEAAASWLRHDLGARHGTFQPPVALTSS